MILVALPFGGELERERERQEADALKVRNSSFAQALQIFQDRVKIDDHQQRTLQPTKPKDYCSGSDKEPRSDRILDGTQRAH
jgi:hypothetical protein